MFLRNSVLWVLWTLVIIALSTAPGKELPHIDWYDFISFDKLAHLFVYAVLVFLMLTGLNRQFKYPFLKEKSLIIVIVYTFLLGFSMEIVQYSMIVDRSFEWDDLTANSVGVALGSIFFYFLYKNCLARS